MSWADLKVTLRMTGHRQMAACEVDMMHVTYAALFTKWRDADPESFEIAERNNLAGDRAVLDSVRRLLPPAPPEPSDLSDAAIGSARTWAELTDALKAAGAVSPLCSAWANVTPADVLGPPPAHARLVHDWAVLGQIVPAARDAIALALRLNRHDQPSVLRAARRLLTLGVLT